MIPSRLKLRPVGLDDEIAVLAARLGLNDWLAHQGGHIGYGVLPEHRRQGFATEILRQSVIIARSEGIDPSLVCCDDANVGSALAIERCGGVLENVVDGDDGPTRRYWISSLLRTEPASGQGPATDSRP